MTNVYLLYTIYSDGFEYDVEYAGVVSYELLAKEWVSKVILGDCRRVYKKFTVGKIKQVIEIEENCKWYKE